jgi:superfamily II DNA or RNA helicase
MNSPNPKARPRRRRYRPRPGTLETSPTVSENELPEMDLTQAPAEPVDAPVEAPVLDGGIEETIDGSETSGEASIEPSEEGATTAAPLPSPIVPNGAPQLLTLERRTVRQFARIALSRGRHYFSNGRVSDPIWTDKKAELSIQGAEGAYKITFDFSQAAETRRLPAQCECPAYARGIFCKHLWAAILQIDKVTPLQAVPESGSLKLMHSVPRQAREHPGNGNGGGIHPRVPNNHWSTYLNQLQGVASSPVGRHLSVASRAFFVIAAGETASTGKLVLDLWTRNQGLSGELGPLRPHVAPKRTDFSHFADIKDQEVLQLLARSGEPQVFSPHGRHSPQSCTRFTMDPVFESHLIPLLANTGKLFLSRSQNGSPDSAERSLRMDRSKPWELEIKLDVANLEHYQLVGVLRRDSEFKPLVAPITIFKSGFLLFDDRIGRFAEPSHAPWAVLLRTHTPFLIPKAQGEQFLTRVLLDPNAPRMSWPPELGWEALTAEPKPRGVFHPLGQDTSTGRLTLTVSFDYAGREIPLSATQKTIVDAENKRVYFRNVEFEERTLLKALEVLRDPQGTGSVAAEDLHRAASELCRLGWTIHIENQKIRVPNDFSMNVSSGTDWFDLKLEASFGDVTVSQAELAAALDSKSGLVRLSDGSMGMLPQDWIAKYASVAEFGTKTSEGLIRFNRSQGLMLNLAIADDPHLRADTGFTDFRAKVREFDGVKEAKTPEGFHGELRNYQKEGLTWLKFLEAFETGGILADDMGLGKTIQVLAFLRDRARVAGKPCLVIAPKSLAFNWTDEAARFVPDLKVVRYTGTGRAALLEEIGNADLVITTYGAVRTDIDKLREIEFEVAIIDEAQAIKNPKAKASIAVKRIRARQRLALTGTPVENSIQDLLSILSFTNPDLLNMANLSEESGMKKETLQALGKLLKPFMLRRTKEKVLKELPAKSEQVLYCEMSGEERAFYNAIRDRYKASLQEKIEKDGMGASKIHVLEALLRLRQAACHGGLIDESRAEESSAKISQLISHIQEVTAEGHKALVFSQFTSLLALVKKDLDAEKITYEYLDGKTQDRKTPVERFQKDPKCPVFLISLKAGGTGLNLTAADYVFILDPWWNPAVEAQAIGRAHRLGQTQKVFAYRMIARGTVEEKILELQKSKKELAESLISEDTDLLGKLTREDLEMLLN